MLGSPMRLSAGGGHDPTSEQVFDLNEDPSIEHEDSSIEN